MRCFREGAQSRHVATRAAKRIYEAGFTITLRVICVQDESFAYTTHVIVTAYMLWNERKRREASVSQENVFRTASSRDNMLSCKSGHLTFIRF